MTVYSGANSTAAWQTLAAVVESCAQNQPCLSFPICNPGDSEWFSPHFLTIRSWKTQAVIIKAIYSLLNVLLI